MRLASIVVVMLLAIPARGQVFEIVHADDLGFAASNLRETLDRNAENDNARFALGIVETATAFESLARHAFMSGARTDLLRTGALIGVFVRPPNLPPNPDPTPITYDDTRTSVQRFVHALRRADTTLAKVDASDVKIRIRPGDIRLDLDGDGKGTEAESLWNIMGGFGLERRSGLTRKTFVVAFDRGDVDWLRAHLHLAMALGEIYLAHDAELLWNHAGHVMFAGAKVPHDFLIDGRKVANTGFEDTDLVDFVALVHCLRFEIREPARMRAALEHFETMVTLSRSSWWHFGAEDDDELEWIPNPTQTAAIPGASIDTTRRLAWLAFLAEAEALLKGERRLRFWRTTGDGRGVNVRKVFTEPRDVDVVLWVQGTGAAPFLEEGPPTTPGTWRRLQAAFDRRFLRFAFWLN